jgi:hypothetical protein
MSDEYTLGFSAGRNYAFGVILEFIEHHREQDSPITEEHIEQEIQMILRKAREEESRK